MHPDLAKLIALQAHDIEARRLHDQMSALGKQVAALETTSKAAVGRRAAVLEQIAKEEALRRREESEIADLRQKLERSKKKLDMTTTAHQLEALEHEVAFVRSEITRLEDAEIESMERDETLQSERVVADAAVADAEAALARQREFAAQTIAVDQAALANLEQQRAALRAEIAQTDTGDDALGHYDRIARAKGTAVSEAQDQKCSACQMMLRPQRWNDIRDNSANSESAHTIMNCESCGRMLYYDPARDAPQRKSVAVESVAGPIIRSAGGI